MHLHEHESRWQHLYEAHEREARWRVVSGVLVAVARTVLTTAVVLGLMLVGLAAVHDCGNVDADTLSVAPESRMDPEAWALASAALAWQPDAQPRAATVYELAGYVVRACREVVGSRLGDDCPALLMALSWRESRWRPHVTGRPPWLAVGAFQLHGAALDTWTRAEARELRRNTMLAAWWLTECDRACVGLEEALTMYATGECGRSWGARRLIRMAAELRQGGAL